MNTVAQSLIALLSTVANSVESITAINPANELTEEGKEIVMKTLKEKHEANNSGISFESITTYVESMISEVAAFYSSKESFDNIVVV